MFDGLLKVDRRGNIVANIAAEYFISDDSLTYIFYLRDDVYWYYDGDDSVICTAHDFVFAFRRLFSPDVKSENAPQFYSIKNAEKVHRSRDDLTLEDIGVEAVSDFELIITLEYPNPLLPYLLTTTPAMPCSEELFDKTGGRYGLGEKYIPSNGAFYITKWNYDRYSTDSNIIIMRRNSKNSEADMIYPRGLNFFIGEQDTLSHFMGGTTHSLITEGDDAGLLMTRDYPYDSFENAVWGFIFNVRNNRVFNNYDLRYALASGFDRGKLNVNRTGWRDAYDAIPPLINLGNDSYRKLAGDTTPYEYDFEAAREAYERGALSEGYDRLGGISIIIPENNTAFEYASRILQQWQSLGFYCKIETLEEEEYIKRLQEGSFDIAMMKLTGEYNSPDAYLNRFGTAVRITPSPAERYNEILTEARRTSNTEEAASLFKEAEDMLIEQAIFVPVCYQTELFFYDKKSADLIYNPFTGIINYKEGKYFK